MKYLKSWRALSLACALAVGPAPQAQAQAPPRPAITPASYPTLFASYEAFLVKVKQVCKSGECNALVGTGTVILKDGQTKHAKGLLIDAERKQFHHGVSENLLQIINALGHEDEAQDASARLATRRGLQACIDRQKDGKFHPVQDGGYNCDQVFAAALAICSLNLIATPIAAAICTAVAIYGYVRCLERAGQGGGYGGPDPNAPLYFQD